MTPLPPHAQAEADALLAAAPPDFSPAQVHIMRVFTAPPAVAAPAA